MSSVQGIGSILGFECEKPLRRTLSAVDMSSKNLLSTQSGVSPLETIASSDEVQIAVEKNDDCSQQQKQPGQFDIWYSIQIQKPSCLPPPYVHPLVKKSKSCLTLKSLEICTEKLGSESGSDGYPPSDISLSDIEEQQEEIQVEEAVEQVVVEEKKEVVVMNYSKKSSPRSSAPRSFPPPLKSLSKSGGGGIQMKTHRKDGRLVLEAVPVPTSQNCFSAKRQNGRLVLTFASPILESKSFNSEEDVFETDEEVAALECSHGNEIEQDQEDPIIEEEEEEDKGIVLEMTSSRVPKLQPTGVINVHRSALLVNKFIGLTNNRNDLTTWSSSNLKNRFEKMNSPSTKLLPQSLPISQPGAPRMSSQLKPSALQQQTVTAAVVVEPSFNRYEYSWRKDASSMVSVGGIYHSLNQQSLPNTNYIYHNNNNPPRSKKNYRINNNSNNIFVKDSTTTAKGGKYYMEEKQNKNAEKQVVEHLIVPAYKPEPRPSFVFPVPHCIATS